MIVNVNVTPEHIQRLKGTKPIDALIEIIWNSIDAGATEVELSIDRNALTGIQSVTVKDNGTGIDIPNIKDTFGALGRSQKVKAGKNPRGMNFHGSLGEGRFKAYALGAQVEWTTTSDGKAFKTVSGNFDKADAFKVENAKSISSLKKGTLFKATNLHQENIVIPENELESKISVIFAPILVADKHLKIRIQGKLLDPTDAIRDEHTETLSDKVSSIKLLIWKHGKNADGYWCTSGYSVKKGFSIDDIYTHHSFSLFIESPAVATSIKKGTIEAHDLLPELHQIKEEAFVKTRLKLAQLDKVKIAETVSNLKESELYPFKGEPNGELDKIERKVFDVCVTKVVESIPNFASGSKDKQKIAFHLLRTAIESSPSSVQHIFEDILKLPQKEIDELSKILKKYSVAGLIQLGKLVADRREILAALEKLVFDKSLKKAVLERRHLHKIVENETWIFGEEFSLGTSDASLEAVLESHRTLFGNETEEVEVENEDGKSEKILIPDLVFARQYKIGSADKFHHLVIELKRPSVILGSKEKSQIETYASEIAEDSRFDKSKTKWTFIVLSGQIDPKMSTLFTNDDGLIAGNPNTPIAVYMKTWSSIFHSSKGRMQHLWDKSQLVAPTDSGMQHLNEQYNSIFQDIKSREMAQKKLAPAKPEKKNSAKKKPSMKKKK